MTNQRKSLSCSASFLVLLMLGILASFLQASFASDLQIQGGPGGAYFRAECPKGAYLTGLAGRAGSWVDQLAPICSPWEPVRRVFGAPQTMKPHGTSNGGSHKEIYCTPGSAIAGLDFENTIGEGGLSDHRFVSRLFAYCQGLLSHTASWPVIFNEGGAYGGQFIPYGSDSYCPVNEVAVGFHGRAGLFIDALGLICGPVVALKPGSTVPSQAMNTPSAFPTAPRIDSPVRDGIIVKGKGVFKITPSKYLTGTHAQYQLRWLNPPASSKGKGLDFYNQEISLGLIANPTGLPVPQTLLAQGIWEIRVRINRPQVGDWSDWVRFTYYLQHPSLGTAAQDAQQQDLPFGVGGQQKNMSGDSGMRRFRPQMTPQQGMGETMLIRPRGVEGKDDTRSNEAVGTSPETEKKP